jgi:para-nitrobenzyl esterase
MSLTKPVKQINRIIEVREGKIKGIAAGNPAYTIFRGVPYANPPVGSLRWKAATSPKPWEGIRNCEVFPAISIQAEQQEGSFYQKEFFPEAVMMSEDCLYLNIWTPDTTGTEKLPILLYIHGGAFISGYSWEMEFDGEAMCRRDCILVTIGYRLGALGFFAHPELSETGENNISGNYAITDCIQALNWVRENAKAFGGDADHITIFGQSAGGAMVQSLITCPPAKGLFKRAIIQSAGGINTLGAGFTLEKMEELGEEITKKLGKSLSELKTMEAVKVSREISNTMNELMGFGLYFNPCTDGYYQLKSAGEAIAFGEHHEIDIMTGTVGGDGELFAGWPVKTVEEFNAVIRTQYQEFSEEYLKLYQVKITEDLKKIQEARKKVISLLAPRSWAYVELKNNRKPLYLYHFNRRMPGDDAGAYHSAELWYIFGTLDRSWRSMAQDFDIEDYKLSRAMTDYWCNFAKTGNPNGVSVPVWEPFTAAAPMTLVLDEKQISNQEMREVSMLDDHVRLQHRQILGNW